MKIRKIKIAGFRGLPPVEPPDVEISLSDTNNNHLNLLLFAPNAFGKSSIADGFEWFFKERVRGCDYCDSYEVENNAHILLGEDGFIQQGYIELTIEDNGNTWDVKKFFDKTGNKISEDLGDLKELIEGCKDEIIVLDHDRFRQFVSSAQTDKFATFSSLIGYEDLDFFRAGLDSISQTALSNYLEISNLTTKIESQKEHIRNICDKLCSEFNIEYLEDEKFIANYLIIRIKSFTSIFPNLFNTPNFDLLSDDFWGKVRLEIEKIRKSNDREEVLDKINQLEKLKSNYFPLSDSLRYEVEDLRKKIPQLSSLKVTLEKEILSNFYKNGLKIVRNSENSFINCPLCGTEFNKNDLVTSIELNLLSINISNLDINAENFFTQIRKIQFQIKDLLFKIKEFPDKNFDFNLSGLWLIDDEFDFTSIENFDETRLLDWCKNIINFDLYLKRFSDRLNIEIEKNINTLKVNGFTDYLEKFDFLSYLRDDYFELIDHKKLINSLEIEFKTKNYIIESLRTIAKNFRKELSDFSGRVIEIINTDIKNYYQELHPKDHINPYLDVSVKGSTRTVKLKCDFQGKNKKDATSILSESHRNSLGLAIFLAFQKYKHLIQNGLDFIVFDDVTQSFDTEHRINLINLLENPKYPEIRDKQILFFTHDSTLADIIKKPGENEYRTNWIRKDIKNWWIKKLVMDIHPEPLQIAKKYVGNSDAIAAAVYARQALEKTYKILLKKYKIKVLYTDNPKDFKLEDMRRAIMAEIKKLHNKKIGIIDPNNIRFQQAFMSQRILNMTVHDSSFLDNPITIGDVDNSISIIEDLQKIFRCTNCDEFYPSLFHALDKNGKLVQLKCNCGNSIS